uniref:Dipeptidyl-peptidase IV n=1 Tax=Caenorhabditis tropicalis TaxID=1561998 RepID=A0A1I7TMY0_9PELO
MENDNYDVEEQGCSVFSGKHSYVARTCCVVFILIICLIFLLSVIFVFMQRPVDLNSQNASNSSTNDSLIESTSSKPKFQSLLTSRRFTFDQLFSGKMFLTDSYDYIWLPDGSFVHMKIDGTVANPRISKIPLGTFETKPFMSRIEYARSLSSDGEYAYASRLVNEIWRHSAERLYHIVKITNGNVSSEQWHVGPDENSLIQAFYWNPNTSSHDFVYVHNYNLYYQRDPERPDSAIQLTMGGSTFNRFGIANWLYEEEILEVPGAVWWSPSGRYVSYLRFDDREVNRIFLPKYNDEDSYVEYFELPYPKAGVLNNSLVTQYIWDSENHKIVETAPPNELSSSNGNYYVLTNKWITIPKNASDLGEERLITVWTNRDQNYLYYSLCNEQDCVMILSFPFRVDGRQLWVQPRDVIGIFPTESGFLTLLPHSHEDGNIYNHVAHIEMDRTGTGKITRWIGDNFDVISIKGYSKKLDALTFTAYGDGIGEHGIYIVKEALYGSQKNTLHKVSELFDECRSMTSPSADPTGERIVVQCEKPFDNTRLYLVDVADTTKRILLDGGTKAYIPFEIPIVKFGKFPLPSGIDGHYMLMKPPNLQDGAKIPLLLDIYGGPDSKNIVSQYDIAYARIDVRGSGGRGWKLKEQVYKNLGEAEVVDTLDMVREFLNNVKFIDEDRIAVMGWSYGGFLTSKIAIKDQGELVKCAISIAPVTDFKYYDSAYTERYLGQPSDNPVGYSNTNVIPHARNVTNVKYFLAHGERDDNVHYQNSARWSEALQYNGVHFTQLVYANEAHSLSHKLHHLYSEIQRFLMNDCFNSNLVDFL